MYQISFCYMSYFYLKTSLSVNIDGAYLFMIATVYSKILLHKLQNTFPDLISKFGFSFIKFFKAVNLFSMLAIKLLK